MAAKEYGPKVVDANVVRVSTSLYRAAESFAYSSLKTAYPWNIGVHLCRRARGKLGEWSWEDTVIFEKPGKWTLWYVERVEQNPPSEAARSENYVVLETPNLRSHIKYDGARVEVADPAATFAIDAYKDPIELERTFIAPDRDLPFAEPLSLARLVEKMALYFEAAAQHIKECARKEVEAAVEAKAEGAAASG
jgi:hypothetical protein